MDRFDRRVVVIGPGETRAVEPAEWRDALVVVQAGAVEVEDCPAWRVRFAAGAVVTLDGAGARTLRGAGPGPAVLRVVSRRLRAVR